MSTPNGGLINETNAQYYAGSQQFYISTGGSNKTFTSTFDTNLIVGDEAYSDPGSNGYNLNNFKVFTSPNANTWTELTPINSVETGVVENATGIPSVKIDLVAFNSDIQVGMTVSGVGIISGTKVLSIVDPTNTITGNAYIPSVNGNVGVRLSSSTFQLTTFVPTIQVGDVITYIGAGTPGWTVYDPPSSVTLAIPIAGVTEFSLSPFQPTFSAATTPLLRFEPTLTGTNTLTLTAYNNTIVAGMRVSGTYIPDGTVVVSNVDTLVDAAQRSVITLNRVMTRRPDNNAVYSFDQQELTVDQNATVVNGSVLTFTSVTPWSMINNVITVGVILAAGTYFKIQMNDATLNQMHGSYEYTRLSDVIDNFMIGYIGAGKLITSAKRTDIIFHAKRGLQEFSYDTLKSVRSQELQVPSTLSLIIPQDYVNYVKLSWADELGVLHTIYPTNNLNQSPYEVLAQDDTGAPIQDSNAINTEVPSEINAAWEATNPRRISGAFINDLNNSNAVFDHSVYDGALGQRYGLEPQTSQKNGWFKIDESKGTFNFSSNLRSKIVLVEYISDGNAYDINARIPKLAEEALYAYIIYAILSVSRGIQEYIVRRFQKEKSAKLRNAKIRLSNLKLDQIIQVMRGKSKWIK
tara:strand:+ start:1117 stop:3018 length:1902 start_codon:yes stop_codon:yes gene_type:complete